MTNTPEDVVSQLQIAAGEIALKQLESLAVPGSDGKIAITNDQMADVIGGVLESFGIERYFIGLFQEPCEHGCPHGSILSLGMSAEEIASFGSTLSSQALSADGVIDSTKKDCR